jgi:hypothetical protein
MVKHCGYFGCDGIFKCIIMMEKVAIQLGNVGHQTAKAE